MKPTFARRYRCRTTPSTENSFFKKEGRQEHAFFGSSSHETFFHPDAGIQRKCEKCEEDDKKVHRMAEKKEEEKLQKKENSSSPISSAILVVGKACQRM